MVPTFSFVVVALDSTYRWGSSVTPDARGAKWPPVRAAGIHSEIRKYYSWTRPPRRPHFTSLHPPGLFDIACIVGIGEMCAVWAGRAGGNMPYAAMVGAARGELGLELGRFLGKKTASCGIKFSDLLNRIFGPRHAPILSRSLDGE